MWLQPSIISTSHRAAALPDYDFTVDNLSPKHQTLSRFKRLARATLSITNRSETAARFYLSGQGQTAGCQVEFEPPDGQTAPAPQAEFILTPGATAQIPVRVMMSAPPLVGLGRKRYTFVVTVTLSVERPLSRSVLGSVAISPLVGPFMLLLLFLGVWQMMRLTLLPWWLVEQPAAAKVSEPVSVVLNQPALAFTQPLFLAGNPPPDFPEPEVEPSVNLTYRQMFEEIAGLYNLDWRILAEIAYRESNFNPWAIGQANEMGLMQILPSTWNEWAPQVGVVNPYDPYSSIQVAAAYLAYLREFCQANGYPETYWMLVGYNWGPDNLQQLFQQQGDLDDVPELPRNYALKIMQFWPQAPIRHQKQLGASVGIGWKIGD